LNLKDIIFYDVLAQYLQGIKQKLIDICMAIIFMGVTVMNMKVRYGKLCDAEMKSSQPFDTEANTLQQSANWQDMVGYYIELVGQGRIEDSQKLLIGSLVGKKAGSKVLEYSSSPNYDSSSFH
jgi:hypothetical protein